MTATGTPDIAKYCGLMEEIRLRLDVVNALITRCNEVLHQVAVVESTYLQYRKILELIALSSLVANQEHVARVHSDFAQMWHAGRILRDVKRLNPDYYPQPVVEKPSGRPEGPSELVPPDAAFLNEDQFVELYGLCADLLHAANPYRSPIDYGSFASRIPLWHHRIINLLNSHYVRLANDPNLYLVHLHEADGRTRGYVMVPKPQDPSPGATSDT